MGSDMIIRFIFIIGTVFLAEQVKALETGDTVFVKKTTDFTISGKGDHAAWQKTSWQYFVRVDPGGNDYQSRSKILYSDKGIYLLFEGEDELVTTKDYQDGEEIYEGDVFEFFLQSEKGKAYFEYEVNHLGKQLVLTLSGISPANLAWSPWGHEYKNRPLIQSKVFVSNTEKKEAVFVKPGSRISSWAAEIFLPYAILSLLPNAVPSSGSSWTGNFCRIDNDSGKQVQWSWSKRIKKDFHERENFGTIIFE